MGVNSGGGRKAPGPAFCSQNVLHKWWPVGPLRARQGRVAPAASRPGCLEPLLHGQAGLLGLCLGSTRREDFGRVAGAGGQFSTLDSSCWAPPHGASFRPGWVGPPPTPHPQVGRPGSPQCSPPGWPLPHQPVGGGWPRADGRGTPSQFAAATATRRGGGPGGRWGQGWQR